MLNYKQLYYFWNVAKAGGVIRAAERLNVTPQTISGQLGELEKTLGTNLFRRTGRRLELTSAGTLALRHAEEIFQIGNELEALLRNRPVGGDLLFRVGVVDAVPKSMAHRLLKPALGLAEPVRLICHEDKPEALFGELALHKLDLVIADRPLPRELGVKGYNHELGRSSVTFCATPRLADLYRDNFPHSLYGAPLLMPGEGTSLRGEINHWLLKNDIQPHIVGEFDDTVLMKAFGQAGVGVFPVPAAIAEEVRHQYGVVTIGYAEEAVVRYFAISQERRLKHPAVIAVRQGAKRSLFVEEHSSKHSGRAVETDWKEER
jgi:LysR family transcriptional regulator, transcriptional activator of nhaA